VKELAPLLLQGLFMTVDEFYCHRRRPLRKWERIGHPVDTFFFSLCFVFLWFATPSENALWIYGGLAVVSCLLITKDEWQHLELCSGFENWLHAILFILHPVVLIWSGYLWWTGNPAAPFVLAVTLAVTILFFIYQTVYWNFLRHD